MIVVVVVLVVALVPAVVVNMTERSSHMAIYRGRDNRKYYIQERPFLVAVRSKRIDPYSDDESSLIGYFLTSSAAVRWVEKVKTKKNDVVDKENSGYLEI